jgi:hypothetical protein
MGAYKYTGNKEAAPVRSLSAVLIFLHLPRKAALIEARKI